MLGPRQSDAQLFGLKPPAWRGAYCCCEHHPLRDARGCGILSLSSPSISQGQGAGGCYHVLYSTSKALNHPSSLAPG